MSLQHGTHARYPLQKKKMDFLRKSASLPNTPLSEGFKFEIAENETSETGIERKSGTETGRVSRIPEAIGVEEESNIVNNRSIDFGNLTRRGVSFMMDSAPVLSKSRTQKFHKLFKTVPDIEYPADYFSCAYIGDILLQGNLYVSQNWFCFYSRIRGRGRLLEIPMDSVISITREKTAIIFPNAIGLQTKNDKFAFGSFISRDSTYKFLISMWKKSQEAKTSEGMDAPCDNSRSERNSSTYTQDGCHGKRNSSLDNSVAERNGEVTFSNQSHSNSKTDSSDNSESSICIESGSVDASDANEKSKIELDLKSDSNSSPVRQVSHRGNKRVQQSAKKDKKMSHVKKKTTEVKSLQFPYSVMHCIDREKTIEALHSSAAKLQKIPRTNLLLAICTILVLFLMLSAVGLTYKILNLEMKISSRNLWTEADHTFNRDKTYMNILGLQSVMRESTAEHVQDILKANLKILQEINSSLQNLKSTNERREKV